MGPMKIRPTPVTRLGRLLAPIERCPFSVRESAGFALVFALGYIDYATGPDLSFVTFYLLPVFWHAWFLGPRQGYLMAVASAMVWYASDHLAGHDYAHPLIPFWNALVKGVFFLIAAWILSALKRALEHERELARRDPLTGLLNRRAFAEWAEVELARVRRHGKPLSLAYLDVDHFKDINDRLGHAVGDQILRVTGRALREKTRETDAAVRLGGDEFALLLPEMAGKDAVETVRRVRSDLRRRLDALGHSVTFSIGLVTCSRAPDSVENLLQRADRLMYEVKRSGSDSLRHDTLL